MTARERRRVPTCLSGQREITEQFAMGSGGARTKGTAVDVEDGRT